MKKVEINQKIFLARHWFKWYVVSRGGKDWQRLKIEKYQKARTLADITKSLGEESSKNQDTPEE